MEHAPVSSNCEVTSALHGTRVGGSWTPTYKDRTLIWLPSTFQRVIDGSCAVFKGQGLTHVHTFTSQVLSCWAPIMSSHLYLSSVGNSSRDQSHLVEDKQWPQNCANITYRQEDKEEEGGVAESPTEASPPHCERRQWPLPPQSGWCTVCGRTGGALLEILWKSNQSTVFSLVIAIAFFRISGVGLFRLS